MLIANSADYIIGDIVLTDGKGPVFAILSWLLGRFKDKGVKANNAEFLTYNEEWRKLKRKPWHVGFLTGKEEKNGQSIWKIGEARGKGVEENLLTELKNPFQVFRWFETPPDETKVREYMQKRLKENEGYDPFWGYLFVIVWYFWDRFPRIIDRKWMCWELLYDFLVMFGKPMDAEWEYPLITRIMHKVGYPGF